MRSLATLGRHPWIRHLRLPFNVMLAPIYLYGAASGASAAGRSAPLAEPGFWLALVSLHLFLYGGTTAFNSYYDRDEGPIGGMLTPPSVDRDLLPFSLVVQAIGLLLALPVGLPFVLAWLALFLVFAAYSHPSVRLKAHPAAAMTAIALGQGALGFALGWLVFAPASGLLGPSSLLRMAVTASIVTGLYVVTQSYQVDEDRRRGDRTLPVLLGPARALRLAAAVLAPGGIAWVVDLAGWAGSTAAILAATVLAAVGAAVLVWSTRIASLSLHANFRVAMTIVTVASTTATLLLLLSLARGSGS